MPKRKIILASKSPRRRRLLKQIGLEFEVRESAYKEDMQAKDEPRELAKYLAWKKCRDAARHYDDAIVVGADTMVILDDEIIGKPADKNEAEKILKKLSGREHTVITGLAVIDTGKKKTVNDFGEARVRFRRLSEREIKSYVSTGEPLDKAGAYGLQNRGAVLIEGVSGDIYSVIGLPLNKIYLILKNWGVDIWP